jgi:hypothetical protein
MTLVWIALGAFIGWNFPQPFYAVMFQNYVKAKWGAFKTKK